MLRQRPSKVDRASDIAVVMVSLFGRVDDEGYRCWQRFGKGNSEITYWRFGL
jgi:hypothetical protein